MAAGGFQEFIAGEVLDEDKINDFLMQGVLVFADAAARDAAITTPVEGQFAFLKDTDELQFYDGTDFVELAGGGLEIDYLVIAGGGGSGLSAAAGGAGGYLCSVTGESSGGNITAHPKIVLAAQTAIRVTVGAGGAKAPSSSTRGTSGVSTFFGPVQTIGGGGGAANDSLQTGLPGGSGGGSFQNPANLGAAAVALQGFAGGNGASTGGGGGGGAGAVGANAASGVGGNGGAGLTSSITGSAVGRAGGGGGRGSTTGGTATDGGGAGGVSVVAVDGVANKGGGAGSSQGTGSAASAAANGGSGVVIFAVKDGTTVTFSGGVTETNALVGENRVYSVTAAGPTDTVTIG